MPNAGDRTQCDFVNGFVAWSASRRPKLTAEVCDAMGWRSFIAVTPKAFDRWRVTVWIVRVSSLRSGGAIGPGP